jgi:hypothetical protein
VPALKDTGGFQLFSGFLIADTALGDLTDRVKGPADVGLLEAAGVVADRLDIDPRRARAFRAVASSGKRR